MKLTPIEQFVGSLAAGIREDLKHLESLSSFCFAIRVDGRVHSGDLKVEFQIGESSYAMDVKGGTYRAVIEEFMRRHGWDKANAPLMIGYNGESEIGKEQLPNA